MEAVRARNTILRLGEKCRRNVDLRCMNIEYATVLTSNAFVVASRRIYIILTIRHKYKYIAFSTCVCSIGQYMV